MARNVSNKSASVLLVLWLLGGAWLEGCARLPYTTKVVYESPLVKVVLQHEVRPAGYSHPAQFAVEEVAAILRGFSLREKKQLPLRWFAEEVPPQKLFREDEIQLLAPQLVAALRQVGPEERVYFDVFAPGANPAYRRDVTGGSVAIQDRLFCLTVDYFHVQQPLKTTDSYDPNYPTPWTPPKTYLLYFEPGRFFVTDPKGDARGVDFREFLKASPTP
jgi:hypothetical protein